MRDRATAVMVEFVPITHNPDALTENRRIECDSGLEEGELVYTRWIKLTQRHATGQKSVHLIARFKMNSIANSAIKEGVVIAGNRVWARRMQKEPRRCLKCQSLTARHLAAKYNQQGACGTCGRDHRMDECLETNRDAFWCMNCNTSGHASWDRLCLAFLEISKRMEEADPKHSYRYFPGQEAWTWEQQPGYGKHSVESRQGPLGVNVQDT